MSTYLRGCGSQISAMPPSYPATCRPHSACSNRRLCAVVDAGAMPLLLGGDHGVSIAALRAVARRHGPLALVHFDAHSDTWDTYFGGERHSAGTPFRRAVEEGLVDPARSIQLGLRGSLFGPNDIEQSRQLGFEVCTTDEMLAQALPSARGTYRPALGSARRSI